MHEGQIEGMYEAFANLIIVQVQPLRSLHLENLGPPRGGYSQQCLYWKNYATSWQAPNYDREYENQRLYGNLVCLTCLAVGP